MLRAHALLIAAACLGSAQTTSGIDEQRQRVAEAMRASIERQKASVAAQVQTFGAAAKSPASFFTAPWNAPVLTSSLAPDCDPVPDAILQPVIEQSAAREKLSP